MGFDLPASFIFTTNACKVLSRFYLEESFFHDCQPKSDDDNLI